MRKFLFFFVVFLCSDIVFSQEDQSIADSNFYLNLYEEFKEKDLDKAIYYAEKHLDRLAPEDCTRDDAELMLEVARYYQDRKYLFSRSIEMLDRAVPIYKRVCDDESLADSYLMLADLHQKIHNYDQTLKYCNLALEIYLKDEEAYVSDILSAYNLLGIVHLICNDIPTAKKYFLELSRLSGKAHDTDAMILALNNLSTVGMKEGDTAQAGNFLKEAVSLSENGSRYKFRSLRNLAVYYYLVGDHEIYHAMVDSLRVNAKKVNEVGEYHYLNGLYKLSVNDTAGAIAEYKQALDKYRMGEFNWKQQEVLYDLSSLYRDLNDVGRAYEYISEYIKVGANRDQKMYQRLFAYQNSLNQQKMKEVQNQRKDDITRVVFIIVTVCLILLTIVSIIYGYKYHIVSKKEIELANEKKANDKISKEINKKQNLIERRRLQEFEAEGTINMIYESLKELNSEIEDEKTRYKLNRICKDIVRLKELPDDQTASAEEQYLPEFNTELIRNLSVSFPNLSMNERRLCAFLNLNLSTKEIAEITKQSPHSINISRYRLRKKLGITNSDISIHKFLDKYN